MEFFQAIGYYWQVLCRAVVDWYKSFGLWTVFASALGICLAIGTHILLVRWSPVLKERLGDPMTRWWIWMIYTLVPLGGIAILLAIYNLIMAPARMYRDLADRPNPATVGDPQDAADIRALTRKLIGAEGERDEWKGKHDASERQRQTAVSELEKARQQLDNRQSQAHKRAEIVKWIARIEAFQNTLSNDKPRTEEDFQKFIKEFGAFARINLDDSERALLDSWTGLPQFFTARNLEGTQLQMFKETYRWGLRLNQFLSPIDYSKQGPFN